MAIKFDHVGIDWYGLFVDNAKLEKIIYPAFRIKFQRIEFFVVPPPIVE